MKKDGITYAQWEHDGTTDGRIEKVCPTCQKDLRGQWYTVLDEKTFFEYCNSECYDRSPLRRKETE